MMLIAADNPFFFEQQRRILEAAENEDQLRHRQAPQLKNPEAVP
jgi:hypothetical protein